MHSPQQKQLTKPFNDNIIQTHQAITANRPQNNPIQSTSKEDSTTQLHSQNPSLDQNTKQINQNNHITYNSQMSTAKSDIKSRVNLEGEGLKSWRAGIGTLESARPADAGEEEEAVEVGDGVKPTFSLISLSNVTHFIVLIVNQILSLSFSLTIT